MKRIAINRKMIFSFITVIVLIIFIVNLNMFNHEPSNEQQEHEHQVPKAFRKIIEPPVKAYSFSLIDQKDIRRSLNDWKGKVVILSFIWTRCPTICPMIAYQFSKLGRLLGDLTMNKVVLVLISIDPEYDTPEILAKWSEAYGGKWYALTGTLEECKKVWENYGMVVMKDPKTGEIVHSVKTIVIDERGYVRYEYHGQPNAEQIYHDVKGLISG